MNKYLEQFKTLEDAEKELERVQKEISTYSMAKIPMELCQKKIALYNYILYLKQQLILEAYKNLELKRG
jgi:hypothetical protein